MRESLKIDQKYLEELAEYSKAARHSIALPMIGAEREEMLNRGWEVLDRFILFLRDAKGLESLNELSCVNSGTLCLDKQKTCKPAI